MSLRKSPTLAPALLAANRRNAQESTSRRRERGKNCSRGNLSAAERVLQRASSIIRGARA